MPENRRIVTTVGRVVFSDILNDGMPFYNCALGKKGCARVIDDCLRLLRQAGDDRPARRHEVDRLQAVHRRGPLASASPTCASRQPEAGALDAAQKRVNRVEKNYENGIITERERYNQLLDIWSHCREELTKSPRRDAQADRRHDDGEAIETGRGQPSSTRSTS
jgi:DNA-directed RNA polymerase subunit beta'